MKKAYLFDWTLLGSSLGRSGYFWLAPRSFGGFGDFAGFDVAGRNAHSFNCAVFDDLDRLQIGNEAPDGNAGGFKTDAARFLGNTASRYFLAHARFFTRKIANSRH